MPGMHTKLAGNGPHLGTGRDVLYLLVGGWRDQGLCSEVICFLLLIRSAADSDALHGRVNRTDGDVYVASSFDPGVGRVERTATQVAASDFGRLDRMSRIPTKLPSSSRQPSVTYFGGGTDPLNHARDGR